MENINSTIENEVVTVDITEGDYNDVYKRGPIVKGTWKQIEEYVQSYFSKEGLERAEEIGSDGYTLAVYQEEGDECQEQEIEYYVTADPVDDDGSDQEVIDLTKEEIN